MEVDESPLMEAAPSYLKTLMKDASVSEWLSCIIRLKNSVIGSNREKTKCIQLGIVPRLLNWIEDDNCPADLKTESVIVLGSLAKGGHDTVNQLVQFKVVPTLLRSLSNFDLKYCEAVLRCLRSIFMENTDCIDLLYQESNFGASYIPTFLAMAQQSEICQECVANILVCACKTKEHQMCLLKNQAISILTPLLQSKKYKIQMPTLKCFAKMTHRNQEVCSSMVEENKLIETIEKLMGGDKQTEMQMSAAELLTNLHRCGAIPATDFIISRKTLGTLVRMCLHDRSIPENIRGAEILAYLVEIDSELQVMASYTHHLISTLSYCLDEKNQSNRLPVSDGKQDVDWSSEMRRAAFLAFASISANDEEIREKVIKQKDLIINLQKSVSSTNEDEVAAGLRCLQSLTRSVQQIRTVLHDNAVWRPLLQTIQSLYKKLRSGNREIMVLSMACLCNLVLEFSPSKEALVENNAINIFCDMCRSEDNIVRLNATWGIMSMSYCATEDLRMNIIHTLGTETLVKCIQDPLLLIREKALSIVRNLLTDKTSIDNTMKILGNEVMEAVFGILMDPDMPTNVVSQALCAISNMADGPSCKNYIIPKTDEINAVVKYLQYPDKNLQLPAIQFVSNLVDPSDDGFGIFPGANSCQRMYQLKTLGVQSLLEALLGTGVDEVELQAQQALKYFE